MPAYGQVCPMALAAEIVAERWTLLILRELAFGSTRFNDIHRGVPRISPALLTRRLRTLEQAQIVTRVRPGRYELTTAGTALVPIIDALANWGQSWLPAGLSDDRADPEVIMWDLHRRLHLDRLPDRRLTLLFTFRDRAAARRSYWIVCDRAGAQYCTSDPGYDVDLYVATDSLTFAKVWYGGQPLGAALDENAIDLDGPSDLRAQFPSWLKLSRIVDRDDRRPSDGGSSAL